MNPFRMLAVLLLVTFFASPVFAMSSSQATRVIENAYEDLLGRAPDSSGLHEFRRKLVDEGWTEEKLRQTIKQSEEYKLNVINNAYEDLLGRKADETGKKILLEKMDNHKWTESHVREWITRSDEYKKKN